jgi:hypothetical protein
MILSAGMGILVDYIDQLIMFCAGLGMTAVGFGYLEIKSPLARHFRWMGPLLAAISIALVFAKP